MLGTAHMHYALAFKHQYHLVVWMAMVGRPARRVISPTNWVATAQPWPRTEQHPEMPVPGCLDRTVTEIADERGTMIGGRVAGQHGAGQHGVGQHGAGQHGVGQRHGVEPQVSRSAEVQQVVSPWRDPEPLVGSYSDTPVPVHVQQAGPFDHVPQLACRPGRAAERRSRRHVYEPPGEPRAGRPGVEQGSHAGAGRRAIGPDLLGPYHRP